MEIRRFESELLLSNMYLLTENGHAIVIDPFADTSCAEGLTVDRIILTHEHYDHISGVNLWKERFHTRVLCSETCAENIQNPRKNLARIFEVFCELQTWVELETIPQADKQYSCTADDVFTDRMNFDWFGHRLDLFEIPGHSAGSIGILADDRYFFSGDSLLEGKDIELRFPGGSRELWESVGRHRLEDIPPGLTVYPGHFKEFKYVKKGG